MSDIEVAKCELCGEPMPPGEEMFKFHGYSGPCPRPPIIHQPTLAPSSDAEWRRYYEDKCREQRKELDSARAEIARLGAIVERLPKTADGVVMMWNDPVFVVDNGEVIEGRVGAFTQGLMPMVPPRGGQSVSQKRQWANAYSTREAARAAADAGGKQGGAPC